MNVSLNKVIVRIKCCQYTSCIHHKVEQSVMFQCTFCAKFLRLVKYSFIASLLFAYGKCYGEDLEYIQQYMQFLSDRDMVLSKNIANADTPNFKPKDLSRNRSDIPSFELSVTDPMHIAYETGTRYDLEDGKIIELKPNGNAVHLEHEMMQKNENASAMQEAANLYSKARTLMKIAITGGVK